MLEILLITLASVIAAALFGTLLVRFGKAFFKFHGKRVVSCPETGKQVGVDVDAFHAAASAALDGSPDLRLKDCTRWPEREACGQECLTQVEEAPNQCLVRTVLERWYAGASCALCGTPIGEIRWNDHRPAFLGPGRKPVAWTDVASENLTATLATHRPICFNCHGAESFRVEHADLVTEDPRPASRR